MENEVALKLRDFSDRVSAARAKIAASARLVAYSRWLPIGIIGIGILLRANMYLMNRSLWLDEAVNALAILNRSFSQLFRYPDQNVTAPLGFLFLEKLMVRWLGNSEYVLRLYPFFCGIVSLFLFYWVLRYSVGQAALLFGLGLFSISNYVIFYSTDLKQYSSDVAVAVLLLWLGLRWQNRQLSWREIAFGSALGAMVIWLSHPAIFVLGGIAIALGYTSLNAEWKRISKKAIVFPIWLCSFTLFYVVSLSKTTSNTTLQSYWRAAFAPFPPTALSDLKWFSDSYLAIFSDPAGLAVPGLAAFAFLVGSISLFSRDRAKFLLLVSPMFLAAAASSLQQYPFSGRLLLFLVPSLIALVVEGTVRIAEGFRTHVTPAYLVLGILFFLPPLVSNVPTRPIVWEEIKPVVNHIRERYHKGDVIYLYYISAYAYMYYAPKVGLPIDDYVIGVSSRDNWHRYEEDLQKLKGEARVWVVFSHIWVSNGVDEEKLFLLFLDGMGTRLDSFRAPGAAVYLYNLQ